MPRFVSVWLPMWPIERLRRAEPSAVPPAQAHRSEPPFALVESGANGLRLTAVNRRARTEGLYPGLALADARAALPGLLTRPARRKCDRAALHALALWCGRYGPRRNTENFGLPSPPRTGKSKLAKTGDEPDGDGIWIDVTGVAHLFGGEQDLLADLCRRLAGFGLTPRLGLADSIGAAWALSRFAAPDRARPWTIAPAGDMAPALAPLPVAALRLPPDAVLLLGRLGLNRIGQLYDLPREALALRFRDHAGRPASRTHRQSQKAAQLAGNVLSRLDQALGRTSEPLAALDEPPVHIVQQSFTDPLISSEGVTAAAAMLIERLCHLLQERGTGGSRFTLGLYRSDGTSTRIAIGTSRPVRDPPHIIELLRLHLDTVEAGFGIDVMTLAADRVEPLPATQAVLPARTLDGALDGALAGPLATPAVLIDRLSNRLGASSIFVSEPADSHIPERAWIRAFAGAATAGLQPGSLLRGPCGTIVARVGDAGAWLHGHAPGGRLPAGELPGASKTHAPGHRPQFLLPAPEPIAVIAEVPEGPPLQFTWRRRRRRIVRAAGPERIAPEWWRAIRTRRSPRPRDYYVIEDADGGRYWVFRDGLYDRDCETGSDTSHQTAQPIWFLHGLFA